MPSCSIRRISTSRATTSARSQDRLASFPESVAAFRKGDGTPWQSGDRLIQGDLAATLDRIASEGPDEFYTGKTAELIVAYMAAHDGLISVR